MKSKALAVGMLLCFVISAVYATPRRILVVGTGRAMEPDRNSADSEAYNAAQVNANNYCAGSIENNNYMKTWDTCDAMTDADGNPAWVCAVNVKAICLVGQ